MPDSPTDIANQALDAIGHDTTLGDITDGSRESEVCLRSYGQCLRQLLRSANWDFAAKEAPLLLLADATGAIPDGIRAAVGTIVPGPYRFSYAYPDDCLRARSVSSWQGYAAVAPVDNYGAPQVPLSLGLSPSFDGQRSLRRSARFSITVDTTNPPQPGAVLGATQGISRQGRTVVLTDVPDASLVYTALVLDPNNWDALFRAAFVSYLASEVALAISKDKKFGLAVRSQQIALTKAKIQDARLADGNEGTTSLNREASWMLGRYGAGASRVGLDSSWDSIPFADGTSI